MNQIYLLIFAFVLPTGEVKVNHTFVPECPKQEEVVATMNELRANNDIVAWGGNCTALMPKREAMK